MPSYNPYFPATYPMYQQSYQYPQAQQPSASQTSSGLTWVQGEAGAKSFPVAPNSTVMLMDSESDRFYLKSADASGMPMPLRVFTYTETSQNRKQPVETVDHTSYVTKDEFEAFKAEIRGMDNNRQEAVTDE